MDTKICLKCKGDKPLEEFSKWKNHVSGVQTWCKLCVQTHSKLEYNRERYRNNRRQKRKDPEYRRKETQDNILRMDANTKKYLFQAARCRAKKYGHSFTITEDDFEVPDLCPLLEVPMIKRGRYAASLDRIRPELGYVPGNVWVISRVANWMKNDATIKELTKFSTNILKLIEKWTK